MSDHHTLTEADRILIREIVQDAVCSHKCRFPEITDEEFRDAWPMVKGMARTAKQIQIISIRILATAFILFVLGLIVAGARGWIAEVAHKIGGK